MYHLSLAGGLLLGLVQLRCIHSPTLCPLGLPPFRIGFVSGRSSTVISPLSEIVLKKGASELASHV